MNITVDWMLRQAIEAKAEREMLKRAAERGGKKTKQKPSLNAKQAVLAELKYTTKLGTKELVKCTGLSVGLVRAALRVLVEEGDVGYAKRPNIQGKSFEYYSLGG